MKFVELMRKTSFPIRFRLKIFFDLVRQINKRTPMNKEKKAKGKSGHSISSQGKSPLDGSQINSNGNKKDCCVLL